ncbi:MAG: hypothetical protein QXH24_03980 [Candidatus Bathyarchaeia archaeon]
MVKKIRELGLKSVRILVSASSSEHLSDIFALKEDYIVAFEVKTSSRGKAYFQRNQ